MESALRFTTDGFALCVSSLVKNFVAMKPKLPEAGVPVPLLRREAGTGQSCFPFSECLTHNGRTDHCFLPGVRGREGELPQR